MVLNFLRRFKISYQLYNLFHKKSLEYNVPLYKKYGLNKKYFSSVSSQDFKNLKGDLNKYDVVNTKTGLLNEGLFQRLNRDVQNQLLQWSDKGYVVLNKFFDDATIDKINEEVEHLIQSKKATWRNGNKIMFAILTSKVIRNLGLDKRLNDILTLLMGKSVDLFQSINFLTGSQQKSHSDSIHMTTFPLGNIIACWVALEDIGPECGPLHYYPGSHKLPYIMNEDFDNLGSKWSFGDKDYGHYENKVAQIISASKLKKEVFLAKKGDVLIWHANLLHGGEPVIDPKSTRKSVVFHYYAKDAICYHEITQRPTLKRVL